MFKSKLLAAFAACLLVALAGCSGGGGGASSGAPTSGNPISGIVYSASELPSPVPSGGKNEAVATAAVAYNAALEAATNAVNSSIILLTEIDAAREAVDQLVTAAESLVEKARESGTAADRTEAQDALTEARQWRTAAQGRLAFAEELNTYNAAYAGSTASERSTLASLSLDQLQDLDRDLKNTLVPAAESLVEKARESGHKSDLNLAQGTLASLRQLESDVQKRLTDLMSGGTRAPDDSGPRPPDVDRPAVSIAGLDATHLEMTDVSFRSRGIAVNPRPNSVEIVCPGVPPIDTECKLQSDRPDFRFLSSSNDNDYSLIHHAVFFENFSLLPAFTDESFDNESLRRYLINHGWSEARTLNGVAFGRGGSYRVGEERRIYGGLSIFGGVGEYSAFYTADGYSAAGSGENIGEYFRDYAAAFGELHSGRPPSGSATWRGAMTGDIYSWFDENSHKSFTQGTVYGNVELTYQFGNNTVNVEITNLHPVHNQYANSFDDAVTAAPALRWSGLDVNADASFYIGPNYGNDRAGTDLHPTLGYIDGDFYGPNAEEAAGVFERLFPSDSSLAGNGIMGAWMAIREGSGGTASPGAGNPSTGHR